MKNLSATYKGLITGTVMILISIGIYFYKGNFDNKLAYITYFTYIAGIIWTLVSYKHSAAEKKNFKAYFTEGFKCFIVITFMMVAFTWIFIKLNPGMKEEMAVEYRAGLEKKGNYTVAEIDDMVKKAKQYFITMLTSMAIFGYLVIGSLITLIGAGFLSSQRKDQENPREFKAPEKF
jgi:Protein of unknown function (DUF4199)